MLLTWGFFIAMALLIVSGGMLYFGLAGGLRHRDGALVRDLGQSPAFAVLHVSWFTVRIGGIVAAASDLPAGTLAAAAAAARCRRAADVAGGEDRLARRRNPHDAADPTLQPAPPFSPDDRRGSAEHATGARAPAAITAIARQGAATAETERHPSIQSFCRGGGRRNRRHFGPRRGGLVRRRQFAHSSHRQTPMRPILDGDTSDPVWRNIRPFSVMTNQGGNFDGKGESKVEIRAVHDGTWAYFLFIWEDPTRSLKQLPLIKEIDGWHLLHDGYERGDEHAYNEDKFSVLLTTLDVDLAGDRTFHASPQSDSRRAFHHDRARPAFHGRRSPMPMSGNGRRRAAVRRDGWMTTISARRASRRRCRRRNAVPYRGGFAPDPGTANYSDNFVMPPDAAGEGDRCSRRAGCRSDLAAMQCRNGADHARSRCRRKRRRALVHDAKRNPRRITSGAGPLHSRRHGRARRHHRRRFLRRSRRRALRGALGIRPLGARSGAPPRHAEQYDVPLKSGTFMRVAAFDHSQIRHTRHVRPIRLEVE